jgi:hypothetical protein
MAAHFIKAWRKYRGLTLKELRSACRRTHQWIIHSCQLVEDRARDAAILAARVGGRRNGSQDQTRNDTKFIEGDDSKFLGRSSRNLKIGPQRPNFRKLEPRQAGQDLN